MEDENCLEFTDTSKEIIIDFGQICRFCLIETNSNISISDEFLLEKSGNTPHTSIFNIVTKLFSIKIEESPNFPSLVCENCYELVKMCYNFSQICQWSDQSLRDCYAKTLQETKTKLHCKEVKCVESDGSSSNKNETEILTLSSKNIEISVLRSKDMSSNDLKKNINCKFTSHQKSTKCVLKGNNILQRSDKIYTLSDRLKEAQTKLAEDIHRSNNKMYDVKKGEFNEDLQDEKSLQCSKCSLKFNNSVTLKFHYAASHENLLSKLKSISQFQCRKCSESFLDQAKLISHREKIHEISESLLSEDDLNLQAQKSEANKLENFVCAHCIPFKIFQSEQELVEHLTVCQKEKNLIPSTNYSCRHCTSDIFLTKESLNEHLINVHKLVEENSTKSVTHLPTQDNNTNPKLFKVFICTDCSPPVSFTNVGSCIYHKLKTHDKQLENLLLKELSAVYVDSLDVFQQCNEVSVFRFKVLCKNCAPPLEFTSASAFVNHMYNYHDESTLENWEIKGKAVVDSADDSKKEATWKCSQCPAVYFRRQSLYYHMKDKHKMSVNFKTMKCPDCEETFYTNRQVIQHGLSTHQKYFANFHKLFEKKILQTGKEEEIDAIKNFECDICQKKYVSKNSLKRHILKTHLGRLEDSSVTCPYCGKTVSSKLNLKSHIEFVHEALFVSCPICKKKINFRTIGKHYNTHQISSDFVDSVHQFLCNLCGKTLKSKKSFEDHQKLHKNIRDQLCDICGSGFTTKKFLHLHKKTHEGIKRKVFECPQCDKIFSGKHTLNRHLLSHSGEKNFICEICSKCFYTLQELNRHLRYHKKEYRFDCQLCKMKFLDKSRFRHHMMRHKNIRPHKCQFCNKMFIDKRKMNLHMAAKHNFHVRSTKAIWKDPKTYIPLEDLLQ